MLHKKFTVAVFLPHCYRGGTLRGAKNIAKMLKIGSQRNNQPIEVIFSCVANAYDLEAELGDLAKYGIPIRETTWRIMHHHEVKIAQAFSKYHSTNENQDYLLPTDGMCNFSDCDFWLLISDRTFPAIAPIKPYGIVAYDYIQRYVHDITSTNLKEYHETEHQRIKTARNAQFVVVTTPQTYDDAIQYVGLSPKKLILAPIEFEPLNEFITQNLPEKINHDYFIWSTNSSPHKNHLRALQALHLYYQEYGGNLRVAITGLLSLKEKKLASTDNPYLRKLKSYIEHAPILRKKLCFLGNLSDKIYIQTIKHAKFLWHPTLIDNGTFSVIEAAYHQVPSLSSDYPQMRYLDTHFKLNLCFSNPRSSRDMAEKLALMSTDYSQRKALLPTQDDLKQFTYPELALEFWKTIKPWLPIN